MPFEIRLGIDEKKKGKAFGRFEASRRLRGKNGRYLDKNNNKCL